MTKEEIPSVNPRLDATCEMLKTIRILQERNKMLEAQIEKMKCCENCRKFHNLSYDCTCAKVCNEWEIKEND